MKADKLRILEVITPSHYSGAERVVTYLSGELARQGHEVLVATKPLPLLEQELARRGVPCEVLPLSGKLNWVAGAKLRQLIRRYRPQVLHAHLSTAAWRSSCAAHRQGLPCVAHVHGMSSTFWYRWADLLICPSQGVRQYLLSEGLPNKRIEVVYNGLDPDSFASLPPAEEVRRSLKIPPGVPVIGTVAHLSPKKGHRILLEAVALLSEAYPDLHCLVIGEGPLRNRLERQAQQGGLGDRVRFLGYRHDAVALTQVFEVAVLPSVQKEGLGLCLLEAAYLGIPGVGSEAPGINEAIEKGVTGLLTPPGNAVALAQALDQLLADPARRRQMGQAARRRCQEEFSLAAQAEKTVAIFRRIIAG